MLAHFLIGVTSHIPYILSRTQFKIIANLLNKLQSLKIQFMAVLTKCVNKCYKVFGHFEMWSDITTMLVLFHLLMTTLQSMQ